MLTMLIVPVSYERSIKLRLSWVSYRVSLPFTKTVSQ